MHLGIPWILGTTAVAMPARDQLGQYTLVLIGFQAKTWAKKWGPKKGPKNKTPQGTHSVCPGAPSFSAPFLTPPRCGTCFWACLSWRFHPTPNQKPCCSHTVCCHESFVLRKFILSLSSFALQAWFTACSPADPTTSWLQPAPTLDLEQETLHALTV